MVAGLDRILEYVPVLGWGSYIGFLVWLWRKTITATVVLTELHLKANEMYTQTTNHIPHSLASIDKNIAVLVALAEKK